MATPLDAERFILFQLNELATSNRHHDFEAICARVAQRRVSSNILLATGPVSAGGDQGRDAESFFTRLPLELPGAAGFAGMASTEPVVVGCTVQRDAVDSKIRADLAAICGQGQPVARVAYFCVGSVPAARQHALQEHAATSHSVSLDIFDGPKLATLLAQRDLVWLAETELQLPAPMIPDEPGEPVPDWYTSDLARLRDSTIPLSSAGDLATIRDGLHQATLRPATRPDLPEWLGYAERLLANTCDRTDRLNAEIAARTRYEIVKATLRGLNSMSGVEHHAVEYLRYAAASDNPAIIEDAAYLLLYCGGAWARHIGTFTADGLNEHAAALIQHVDDLLASTDRETHPGRTARLLHTAAYLHLHTPWDEATRPEPGTLPTPEETTQRVLRARESGTPLDLGVAEPGIDVSTAMQRLADLAAFLPRAPGLPVEDLCDLFEMLTPVLASDSRYGFVRDALDAAIAAVEGDNAVAERCSNRAVALLRAGQPLRALREFHEAKVGWWHGDTLRGSILAMLAIAGIYDKLRLPHAAKQYALVASAAASVAQDPELQDLVPDGFIAAVDYMYAAGAWLDATAMVYIARLAHRALAERPFDTEAHPALEGMEIHQAMIALIAQKHRPALTPWIEETLAKTSYVDDIRAMTDHVRDKFTHDEPALVQLTDEQLVGRPFSDTGPTRHLTFAALGTEWSITCANDRRTVLAAERFAAGVQIVLAELAAADPLFLHSRIHVEIRLDTSLDRGQRVRFRPANDRIAAEVYLASYEPDSDVEKSQQELLTQIVYLLANVSARPAKEFMDIVTTTFADGLLHKLSSGRPYDEVADLFTDDHYKSLADLPSSRLGTGEQTPVPSRFLDAPTTPGPGVTRDAILAEISDRYSYVPTLITQTLPRVLADDTIRQGLEQLRTEGWRDWHLLLAIHNLATTARAGREGVNPQDQDAIIALAKRPESTNSEPIPLHFFSVSELRQQLVGVGVVVAMQRRGLQLHTDTPDVRGAQALLRRRYYYDADAPHDALTSPEARATERM